MAATLLGAGLAPQSALLATQLPQPSTDHAAVSTEEFHTVQVPILPTSPTAELLQPGQQQEGGSSGGAAADATPTNVPTVAVPVARQYPVLRMLCWYLAGVTINQEHADGAAHAHVIADVQQVMHEVWSLCNRLQDEQVFFSRGDLRACGYRRTTTDRTHVIVKVASWACDKYTERPEQCRCRK